MNKTTNHSPNQPNDPPVKLFKISGPDAMVFMNNQTITDLSFRSADTLYTAICNPKGRMIYSCLLFIQDETIWTAVDAGLSDNFLQYIQMRRFRMNFSIEPSTHSIQIDDSAAHPKVADHIKLTDTPGSSLKHDDWWLFLFKAGLPWIDQNNTELFIPQHVNLDQHEIIAFEKGCYPGQEIVARLHFLGKVKKRMQLINYHAEETMSQEELQSDPNWSGLEAFCSPHILTSDGWLCQGIVKS